MRESAGSVLCLLLLAASQSWASKPARVEVAAEVPFSAQQLASAVALRTSKPSPPIRVTMGDRPGHLVIVIGDARREVDVRDLVGPAAARRVALATLDLLAIKQRAMIAVAIVPNATVVPLTIGTNVEREPILIHRRSTSKAVLISVFGLVGTSGRGGSVSASFPLIGQLRGIVAAGLLTDIGANSLRISHLPLAFGIERRWARRVVGITAQARLLVSPHLIGVDDGGDRLSKTGVRFGSSGVLGVDVALTGDLRAVLAGHLEGYATQKQYLVGGTEVLLTERVAFAVTLGLSFGLGGSR